MRRSLRPARIGQPLWREVDGRALVIIRVRRRRVSSGWAGISLIGLRARPLRAGEPAGAVAVLPLGPRASKPAPRAEVFETSERRMLAQAIIFSFLSLIATAQGSTDGTDESVRFLYTHDATRVTVQDVADAVGNANRKPQGALHAALRRGPRRPGCQSTALRRRCSPSRSRRSSDMFASEVGGAIIGRRCSALTADQLPAFAEPAHEDANAWRCGHRASSRWRNRSAPLGQRPRCWRADPRAESAPTTRWTPSGWWWPPCQTFVKRTAPNEPIPDHHDGLAEPPNPLYLRAFAGIKPDAADGPNRAHNPKIKGANPAPFTSDVAAFRGLPAIGVASSQGASARLKTPTCTVRLWETSTICGPGHVIT